MKTLLLNYKSKVIILLSILSLVSACTTPTLTRTERTGIEQLLLSTAIENSLKEMDLSSLSGKKVYINETYLNSYDLEYVKGAIREKICTSDSIIVKEIKDADLIIEPRCGGLGIDPTSSIFGIPSIPIPVPSSTTVQTPAMEIFASEKLNAVTTIAILAYEQDGTKFLATEPVPGTAYFNNYTVLFFFDINTTDIEARKGY